MLFTIATLLIIVTIIWLYREKNLWGEIILGSVVGLIWELATESLWDYNDYMFSLYIYKDVPLSVVLGWVVVFMISSIIADYLYERVKNDFVATVTSIFIVGSLLETMGITLNLWTYTVDFTLTKVIVGWAVVGGFMLWLVRSFDEYIEDKIRVFTRIGR